MNADLATLNRIASLWGGRVAPKLGKLERKHIEAVLADARMYRVEPEALAILAEAAQVDYRPAQQLAEDLYAL